MCNSFIFFKLEMQRLCLSTGHALSIALWIQKSVHFVGCLMKNERIYSGITSTVADKKWKCNHKFEEKKNDRKNREFLNEIWKCQMITVHVKRSQTSSYCINHKKSVARMLLVAPEQSQSIHNPPPNSANGNSRSHKLCRMH